MKSSRREFLAKGIGAITAGFFVLFDAKPAQACMYGTWKVKCPKCGQIDTVTEGTCQHVCENASCRTQVFAGSDVTVVCRNGHPNHITTGSRNAPTTSYMCPVCSPQSDCNLDNS